MKMRKYAIRSLIWSNVYCLRRGGGGGYLGIFMYTFISLFFGGFQKNKYFLGYKDFVDIFLVSSQNWTIFRGQFYTFFGVFF